MTTNTDSYKSGQTQGQPGSAASSFELKGSMLTVIELHVLDPVLANFAAEIKKKVSQAPDFFNRAPVAIDLAQVKNTESIIDFADIVEVLKRNQLIPIGVRNGSAAQHKRALDQGLFSLATSSMRSFDSQQDTQTELQQKAKQQKQQKQQKEENKDLKEKSSYSSSNANAESTSSSNKNSGFYTAHQAYSKTVYQPIRSGQQVYAKGCDLVILSTVSAGADIISDGHIHVYGSLRGRALAGVNGDESARIFCQNLEAQLISIAGYYRVIEEIEENFRNQSVQIYLKDQRVTIEKM